MRIFLTGRPFSVLFSFRSLIEIFTTCPFIISIFINNGQFLYDKQMDPLKSKLVHLIGTLVVLLYNGMSAFQYCEVTFGAINYSILDSLYVVMVTLSTGSRVVMMLLIVISLAVLPTLLADVLNTVRKRNDWGGYVSESYKPFILLVGSFRSEQVTEILDGFLNTENHEPNLNVVFLDINRPNEELKFLERNSIWGHRIQFIHGSVLDERTLKRVQARSATAIFTLSDQHAMDPHKEDERNTVRLWALHCYTVSYNVNIYTYNLSPSTAIYQKMAKEIICVREFKQYLLAMNCRCRGASTLLTNLLHQRRPMDYYHESWQAQYGVVYSECQVVLFGIKTRLINCEHREILLNPENNYVIKEDDLCVYMCESPKEVEDINSLINMFPPQQFELSQLPTPRLALLTGSRKLISRIGQLSSVETTSEDDIGDIPTCYLLKKPATLRELTIESAEGMCGHILVCMHHKVSNIFKFIYNLRSPQLRPNELQDIIFLCTSLPSYKTFELVCRFPKGNCQYPEDLVKAGVKRAKQVVVMSERECLDQYQRSTDSPAM
ncbi:uncharacterized protein BX663DRAFT_532207 [Cokeromyces recurvatus]|uniref:uncharacterized protein n=1 Tax=Cokeromyces recurvatus TaxID=90255 RepID=UPI00221F988A|nr:uncharacterized protein BX663DRAFT_532207 [Cokeromyces recurvatus]KAI7900826.1 hypothetical protein BX663DRAFT_532207 [Cokeromyces recurvatus]